MKSIRLLLICLPLVLLVSGCKTYENLPKLADNVDLERFMGKWYVHGYTPTMLDRNAHNPTETYELGEDGRILTTYQFRKDSFDGELKTYNPVGKVVNTETNAEWRMRFFSVISAPYLVLYVDSDYDYTLIGHPNLEMAWLMSRSPTITDETYIELVGKLEARSFDLETFVRAPHQWPDA